MNELNLLSTEQVMERLGGIGRSTLHRIVAAGHLETARIGKRRMYVAESVDDYIRQRIEEDRQKRQGDTND